MSEHEHEHENTAGIPDEQLPPDLVAGEDNPLAEGLPDGERIAVWFNGPIVYAELSGGTIVLIVAAGLVALVVTVFLARDLHQARLTAAGLSE